MATLAVFWLMLPSQISMAGPQIDDLIAHLKTGTYDQKTEAILQLLEAAEAGVDARAAVPAVVEFLSSPTDLNSDTRGVAEVAILLLGDIAPNDPRTIRTLIAIGRSADLPVPRRIQTVALHKLQEVGATGQQRGILTHLMSDPNVNIALGAAEELLVKNTSKHEYIGSLIMLSKRLDKNSHAQWRQFSRLAEQAAEGRPGLGWGNLEFESILCSRAEFLLATSSGTTSSGVVAELTAITSALLVVGPSGERTVKTTLRALSAMGLSDQEKASFERLVKEVRRSHKDGLIRKLVIFLMRIATKRGKLGQADLSLIDSKTMAEKVALLDQELSVSKTMGNTERTDFVKEEIGRLWDQGSEMDRAIISGADMCRIAVEEMGKLP